MPVFNAEHTVEDATSSILEQSDTQFELIIVDDGSEESTQARLTRLARQDSRIRPFFRKHEGIVAALNFGLQQANGTYIARMDADDISLPRRLEKQRAFLDHHPDFELVACQVEHFGQSRKNAGYAHYVHWTNSLTAHKQISLNRFIESPLAHPSVMFRRRTVKRLGSYRPGSFPEDYELWLRWLEHGVRMAKIPEVLLRWRDQPDRLSRTHERYSLDAFYEIKARYLSRWLKNNNVHHPEVMVWGAGPTSRRRAEMLTRHGINITHYIDVDSGRIDQIINGRPVLDYNNVPTAGNCFIVSYVGLRGVNRQIQDHLEQRGYQPGRDFIFAA